MIREFGLGSRRENLAFEGDVRLAQFVATPESRSAMAAVRRVTSAVRAGKTAAEALPLFLHGPPGTGKSHLAAGLLAAVSESSPVRTAQLMTAADFEPVDSPADSRQGALACDLLIVEDLQHLPPRSVDAFANLLEQRCGRRRSCVITASAGPARLTALPRRLTSRLTSGLVIGLELPSLTTRRYLLGRLAERQKLPAAPGVLDWVATECSGGVRSLQGALTILQTLSAGLATPPKLEVVQAHWAMLAPPAPLRSIARIKARVATYFGVTVRDLEGRKRHARTLWPLQVAIYLARELTHLPWTDLGAEFGGRDPSTLRHAAAKVAQAVETDPSIATAIRLLKAELT